MARRKSEKAVSLYAVYTGKDRTFPKGKTVDHEGVYYISVLPPSTYFKFYLVAIRMPADDLVVPYESAEAVWEDWMPYGGEV